MDLHIIRLVHSVVPYRGRLHSLQFTANCIEFLICDANRRANALARIRRNEGKLFRRNINNKGYDSQLPHDGWLWRGCFFSCSLRSSFIRWNMKHASTCTFDYGVTSCGEHKVCVFFCCAQMCAHLFALRWHNAGVCVCSVQCALGSVQIVPEEVGENLLRILKESRCLSL